MFRLTLAAIVLASIASLAYADDTNTTTVQGLRTRCEDRDVGYVYCLGYVSGVYNVMAILGEGKINTPLQFTICPKGATYAAAAQAFMNWATKHPEMWSTHQSIGVIAALHETWPCKN
jgi:hypothetical protein